MTNVIETIAPPVHSCINRSLTGRLVSLIQLGMNPLDDDNGIIDTIAMASTIAERVSRFTLKPISFSTKKVATNATGMAIAGISVERISCKKIYTTINTKINASINVLITSWIEANKKSLAFWAILIFNLSAVIPVPLQALSPNRK